MMRCSRRLIATGRERLRDRINGRCALPVTIDQRQPNAVSGDRPPTEAAHSDDSRTAPPDDELFPEPTAEPTGASRGRHPLPTDYATAVAVCRADGYSDGRERLRPDDRMSPPPACPECRGSSADS
jgi:hypothetical protein